MPQAALTFSSLLKLSLLKLFYGRKLVAVGVQKRQLKNWQARLASCIPLPHTFVLSQAMVEPLRTMGIQAEVVKLGIDRDKYQPADNKLALREKYNIPRDEIIALHVGHIRQSRNISWLLSIKDTLQNIGIVLVGSTATEQDRALCAQLEKAGIHVMREYLPDIQEIYQLSDIYCFPVTEDTAAMETPLSVLEAMATNLPIISTPFGRLPEQFKEDGYYRYASSAGAMAKLLAEGFGPACTNRDKTIDYSWSATAELLIG